MRNFIIGLGIVIVLLLGFYLSFKGFVNTGVEYEEDAKKSWGNVETALQRRSDLIGNLVEIVKGASKFEKETLESVISARAKATSTTIDISKATPEQIQEFQSAQSGLSTSMSRLLMSVESYPELKSNANFMQLQTELTSTENNLNIVRNRYNDNVKVFNTFIKKFPNSLWNSIGPNYKELNYFEADKEAKNAPKIKF